MEKKRRRKGKINRDSFHVVAGSAIQTISMAGAVLSHMVGNKKALQTFSKTAVAARALKSSALRRKKSTKAHKRKPVRAGSKVAAGNTKRGTQNLNNRKAIIKSRRRKARSGR